LEQVDFANIDCNNFPGSDSRTPLYNWVWDAWKQHSYVLPGEYQSKIPLYLKATYLNEWLSNIRIYEYLEDDTILSLSC
jgi:hypothetical protein